MEIPEVKKAWMAGIIDGEGCITYCKVRNNKVLSVFVTNTDISILDEFKIYYNGGIYPNNHKHRPNSKDCWCWKISKISNCMKFLQDILPYLISKKDKAKDAIEFLNNKTK